MSKQNCYIDRLIGFNLYAIRKIKGFSQEDIGGILGVTYQQIQKYEDGHSRIDTSNLYILSQNLNVPILDFFQPKDIGR